MLWLVRWDSSRMRKDGLQCTLRAREPPESLSWASVRHTERFLAGRMTRVGQWRVPGKVYITPFWADNGWAHGQNGGLRSKGRCSGSQIPRTRWLIGWVKRGGTTVTMQATDCCSCLEPNRDQGSRTGWVKVVTSVCGSLSWGFCWHPSWSCWLYGSRWNVAGSSRLGLESSS